MLRQLINLFSDPLILSRALIFTFIISFAIGDYFPITAIWVIATGMCFVALGNVVAANLKLAEFEKHQRAITDKIHVLEQSHDDRAINNIRDRLAREALALNKEANAVLTWLDHCNIQSLNDIKPRLKNLTRDNSTTKIWHTLTTVGSLTLFTAGSAVKTAKLMLPATPTDTNTDSALLPLAQFPASALVATAYALLNYTHDRFFNSHFDLNTESIRKLKKALAAECRDWERQARP